MDRRFRAFLLAVFALAFWFPITTAQAFPVLPSSFYGVVKHGDRNVADGTLVEAWLHDQVLASGFTRTYQGNSVYALDVRGDDSETGAVDGGRDGDRIQFKVGGVLANETGVWHSGTNTALNLTVDRSAALEDPQPTQKPIPSQTPIATSRPVVIATEILTGFTTMEPNQLSAPVETQPVFRAETEMSGGNTGSATLVASQNTATPALRHPTAVVDLASQADIQPQPAQPVSRRAVIPAIGAIILCGMVGIVWFRSRR